MHGTLRLKHVLSLRVCVCVWQTWLAGQPHCNCDWKSQVVKRRGGGEEMRRRRRCLFDSGSCGMTGVGGSQSHADRDYSNKTKLRRAAEKLEDVFFPCLGSCRGYVCEGDAGCGCTADWSRGGSGATPSSSALLRRRGDERHRVAPRARSSSFTTQSLFCHLMRSCTVM